MKKEYVKPSLEIINFNFDEIIMNDIIDGSVGEGGGDLWGDEE